MPLDDRAGKPVAATPSTQGRDRDPMFGRLSGPFQIRRLRAAMAEATSYAEWLECAQAYDQLKGWERWRERDRTQLYDHAEIRRRHDRLKAQIEAGESNEVLATLNEGIHGDMGGMGNARLYHRSKVGTKRLIDDYIQLLGDALEHVAQADEHQVSRYHKLDLLRRANHCYGRSALMLSGGGGLIYFHHGVIAELADHDALPTVMSGSSAGSWICAQVGSRTDAELRAENFVEHRYPHLAALESLGHLRRRNQEKLDEFRHAAIATFCNDMTFQEAFEHTGRYINISVAPCERHQKSRLLNAITSPNVTLRSAVTASCSLPGLIPATQLECKDARGRLRPYLPGRLWVDGSFAQDLPAKRLARLYGVNHYIVSLINPFALPFVREPALHDSGLRASFRRFVKNSTLEALKLSEDALGRVPRLRALRDGVSGLQRLMDQSYTGDINLILEPSEYRALNALFVYREEEVRHLILAGRRAVWPRVHQIRNATHISHRLRDLLDAYDQPDTAHGHMVH